MKTLCSAPVGWDIPDETTKELSVAGNPVLRLVFVIFNLHDLDVI